MTSVRITSLIIAVSLISAGNGLAAVAASSQLKPVLKAIDPSQAKTDKPTPPPASTPPPSPNPLGKVTGAPVSRPAGKRASAAPTTSPAASTSSSQPDTSYPYGQTSSPASQGPPPSPPPPGPPTPPPGAGPLGQAGSPPTRRRPVLPGQGSNRANVSGGPPTEDMIPDFDKPLPQVRREPAAPGGYPAAAAQPNYGPGWTTQRPAQSYGSAPAASNEEARVVRLEQLAFGSAYPEHELPDRVDHLENEVFGGASTGSLGARLSRLEGKLGGHGAFSQASAPAPPPPVVASAYPQQRDLDSEPVAIGQSELMPVPDSAGAAGSAGLSLGQSELMPVPGSSGGGGRYLGQSQLMPAPGSPGGGGRPLGQSELMPVPGSSGGGGRPLGQSQLMPAPGSSGGGGRYLGQSQLMPAAGSQAKGGGGSSIGQSQLLPAPGGVGSDSVQSFEDEPGPQPTARTAFGGNQMPPAGQSQLSMAQPQGIAPPFGAAGGGAGSADYQAVVNAMPYDKRAGDYFTEIRKGAGGVVARWQSFPIRVHLPQGSPFSWQGNLEYAVKKWGQYIPIKITEAREPADIEVEWVNHLPPRQLGITRIQVVRGIPEVTVYLLRPTYYLPEVPERALQGIFLHEMGHALGIFGHSDFKDDLMQPIEAQIEGRKQGTGSKCKFNSLTPRDVNTLRRIYEAPTFPPDFSSPHPSEFTLRLAR